MKIQRIISDINNHVQEIVIGVMQSQNISIIKYVYTCGLVLKQNKLHIGLISIRIKTCD